MYAVKIDEHVLLINDNYLIKTWLSNSSIVMPAAYDWLRTFPEHFWGKIFHMADPLIK